MHSFSTSPNKILVYNPVVLRVPLQMSEHYHLIHFENSEEYL